MGKFVSRGIVHHVDSTVTCPDCGRRFLTHTVVAEGPDRARPGERMLVVTFTSKRDEHRGQWGQIRVPAESVAWTAERVNAWDKEAES
jgi:hypothetical protein